MSSNELKKLLITLHLINHSLNLLFFVYFCFMSMMFAELEILQKWKNTYWAEYIEVAPIPQCVFVICY